MYLLPGRGSSTCNPCGCRARQVFLDVVESVNLLVNSNGTVVRSEVVGALKMRTFLSGMPECKLGLNDKARAALCRPTRWQMSLPLSGIETSFGLVAWAASPLALRVVPGAANRGLKLPLRWPMSLPLSGVAATLWVVAWAATPLALACGSGPDTRGVSCAVGACRPCVLDGEVESVPCHVARGMSGAKPLLKSCCLGSRIPHAASSRGLMRPRRGQVLCEAQGAAARRRRWTRRT